MVMDQTRARISTQFVVLPPQRQNPGSVFRNVQASSRRHDELLAEMQRFRGRVYLSDGAIRADELTSDGRHRLPIDSHSWHVLSLDDDGRVVACLRYLEETQAGGFDDLWVRNAAMARSPEGLRFRHAVESEMRHARQSRLGFGEVGGWAVDEEHRWTLEPLRIILATYGLLELLGGCTGVATATFRHSSATILRRIGLTSLTSDGAELPPYYDPYYGCQMEVLRFDSRFPNPKYRERVAELKAALTAAPVICRESLGATLQGVLRSFEVPVVDPVFHAGLVPAA